MVALPICIILNTGTWAGSNIPPLAAEFHRISDSIGQSVRFMETITGQQPGSLKRVDFYTSHEALHLHYEQALTRQVPRQWGWFNLSTHFPWIGMRTAELEGSHVEMFRGIRKPHGGSRLAPV